MAQAQGHFEVVSNVWRTDPATLKAPRIAHMRAQGDACFDYAFYLSKNADLQSLGTRQAQLWDHFVTVGQFEGRLWRCAAVDGCRAWPDRYGAWLSRAAPAAAGSTAAPGGMPDDSGEACGFL